MPQPKLSFHPLKYFVPTLACVGAIICSERPQLVFDIAVTLFYDAVSQLEMLWVSPFKVLNSEKMQNHWFSFGWILVMLSLWLAWKVQCTVLFSYALLLVFFKIGQYVHRNWNVFSCTTFIAVRCFWFHFQLDCDHIGIVAAHSIFHS